MGHNSLHGSGNNSMPLWVHNWSAVRLIIHKPMVKPRGLIRFWKICCGPVCFLIVRNGMSVCHSLNSLTTTAIRKVSKWHPLKPCMDGGVGLHWTGRKPVKGISLGPIWLARLRTKFVLYRQIWKPLNPAKRVMQIRDAGLWYLKLVIMFTFGCLQWRVSNGSEYGES